GTSASSRSPAPRPRPRGTWPATSPTRPAHSDRGAEVRAAEPPPPVPAAAADQPPAYEGPLLGSVRPAKDRTPSGGAPGIAWSAPLAYNDGSGESNPLRELPK